MLSRENYLFGYTRSKPSQGSVPDGPALASDFGFCFQCQASSSLVLRRPVETTRVTGHLEYQDSPTDIISVLFDYAESGLPLVAAIVTAIHSRPSQALRPSLFSR